jgi:hypothetical protein
LLKVAPIAYGLQLGNERLTALKTTGNKNCLLNKVSTNTEKYN